MFVLREKNMKRKTIIGSLLLVTIFGLSNCGKDDSTETKDKENPTVSERIMQSTWIEVARTANGQNAFIALDDCEKDNEHSFLSNEVYRLAEGANVCDPDEPGPTLTEWVLTSNTVITIARTDFDIDYITDSTFKISNGGVGGSFSNTYKKK